MTKQKYFLQIELSGEKISAGRIAVRQLLRLMNDFDKALVRTGTALSGDRASIKPGAPNKSIKDEVALDLVCITHGSPTAILCFERNKIDASFPEFDYGIEIIEKSLNGLDQIQKESAILPAGVDSGVLMAWRDIGVLFEHGVKEITFMLNHREHPITAVYNSSGYKVIQEKISKPQLNMRTVEGRLLMADFKEHGTRCRIHPSVGEPILCLFNEEQKDEVLENILCYVKIVGEAKEDPVTGKISSIKIADIQRKEENELRQKDLIPQGTPIPADFWLSPTLEQLAESQGVKPITDVSVLFETWPGDIDDGFEKSIDELRLTSIAGGKH